LIQLTEFMALKKGTKVDRGYATVALDEGVNYRDIAETMTNMGFTMNHSSARNYVLRVMRKFAKAHLDSRGIEADEQKIDNIAKSPTFQFVIAEQLYLIELERREANKLVIQQLDQEKDARKSQKHAADATS
jgi:hypothetical protein